MSSSFHFDVINLYLSFPQPLIHIFTFLTGQWTSYYALESDFDKNIFKINTYFLFFLSKFNSKWIINWYLLLSSSFLILRFFRALNNKLQNKMELIDNGFYADTMWIQCENEDCLKWRLLTIEDAASVDSSKPWYCHMNNDTWFNCCSVPEESYPEESVFHQCGLKLVYSQLPVGTLVLAKMSGWPRWGLPLE